MCEVLRKDIAAATQVQEKLDLSRKPVVHIGDESDGHDHYHDGIRKSEDEFTPTVKSEL